MTSEATSPSDRQQPRVVVGVDGSDGARQALAWAVAKTTTFGEITPVAAYRLPLTVNPLAGAPGAYLSGYRTSADAALHAAIDATDPGLRRRARLVESNAGPALVEMAKDADLLVVGTRGRGSVVSGLLGSVGSYCATHSTVPVIVVPPDSPTGRPLSLCVVGIDGSENSEAALQWAIDHVAPDGRIYAVGAAPVWGHTPGEFDPPLEVLEQHIRETAERSVRRLTGPSYRGPRIKIRIVTKDARVALRRLAGPKVDLLVVGAKGSGHPILNLGSVSSALVHHPNVPTVVVPACHRQD